MTIALNYQLPSALAPLANYRQFILVHFIARPGTPEKMDKVPLNPHTLHSHDPHDPAIWMDISAASKLASSLGEGYGVGFTLTENDPFICLDLDNCTLPDGSDWSPAAYEMMKAFPGAIERSNSGKGLHIWATYSQCPAHGKRNKSHNMELYSSKRFIALGNVANGEMRDVTALLPNFIALWFRPSVTDKEDCAEWTMSPAAGYVQLADEQLIAKALAHTRHQPPSVLFGASSPLPSFADLWNRNVPVLSLAFPPQRKGVDFDHSCADFALARELAYWTGKNCERIAQLMWQSKLSRDKWKLEIHRTYFRDTIIKAVAACDVVYQQATPSTLSPLPEAWPAPTSLPEALPPVQPFDDDLLPSSLRDWVMDIAYRMQCPPDFPAVGAIVAASSLIGARVVMQPKAKDNWQVIPNLWGLVVGRPGVMKSPALNEVLKPLRRLESQELSQWKAAHQIWECDVKIAELQSADNEKKAKTLASNNPLAARALLQSACPPEEPIARRFIVNDATVEKLGELLQKNPWGILSYRDEIYGLLTGMEKQGQEGSRAFYLQAYDGNQDYTFDRIGRGVVHIPRVCLAIIGGIQPGRVQEYVRSAVSGGSADDGLLQRFGLTVWPDVSGEFRHVDQFPDLAASQSARTVFERLAALQPASDKESHIWRFDSVAQALFIEWRIRFEQELKSGELHPAIESHLAKYRKLIPALALVFALIDTPDSGGVVSEPELRRALQWADYLRSHAERLYSAAVMPETAGAALLLKRVKAGALGSEFTPRIVAQKGWAGLNTPEAVRKAADVLTDYHWLRAIVQQTGGRPSERYLVHPSALAGGTV